MVPPWQRDRVFRGRATGLVKLGRTFSGARCRIAGRARRGASGAYTVLTWGPGRKLTPQWLPDGRIAYCAPSRRDAAASSRGGGRGRRRPDYWSEGFASRMAAGGPGHLHRNAVEPRREADRLPSFRRKNAAAGSRSVQHGPPVPARSDRDVALAIRPMAATSWTRTAAVGWRAPTFPRRRGCTS